jgi:hypothetical protein
MAKNAPVTSRKTTSAMVPRSAGSPSDQTAGRAGLQHAPCHSDQLAEGGLGGRHAVPDGSCKENPCCLCIVQQPRPCILRDGRRVARALRGRLALLVCRNVPQLRNPVLVPRRPDAGLGRSVLRSGVLVGGTGPRACVSGVCACGHRRRPLTLMHRRVRVDDPCRQPAESQRGYRPSGLRPTSRRGSHAHPRASATGSNTAPQRVPRRYRPR